MSSFIKLYGAVIPGVAGESGYDFEYSDIYLLQKDKWLKADSPSFGKLSGNVDLLKAAKNFGFYTKSENGSSYTALGMRYLKDYLEKRPSAANGDFVLSLIAMFEANQSIIVRFSGCSLGQSVAMATPIGRIQVFTIKFKDAAIKKLAGTT